jgi:amidase
MDRREFMQITAQAAIVFPFLSYTSCFGSGEGNPENNSGKGLNTGFKLLEKSIEEIQKMMESGELSSKQITQLYLDRIKQIDSGGIKLNSVIEINPDALDIAQKLDEERKTGKIRSKMHGIPILIKDNIDTGDKMMTTAGSLALKGNIASKDAFIIDLLRKSGAVLLGKTNLSEFANWRSTQSVSGWSSRGGQTRNPYVINRNPCGSSSGSGVAVSANLCVLAIGTETDGSIICPASINGIVGIKPTVGLWSRQGIIPISDSQDTAGPMARSVTDAAILLGLLAAKDNNDPKTSQIPNNTPSDYTLFLHSSGLNGKKIGIPQNLYQGPYPELIEMFKNALEQLKSLGAEIIEFDDKIIPGVYAAEYQVLLYEFKDGINKYLEKANSPVKSLTEIIAFNKANEDTVMPYFKQEILEMSEAKGDLNSVEYKEALKNSQLAAREYIDGLFRKYGLDAICGFNYGPAWCTDFINGDHFTNVGMGIPTAIAGYPSISVPMGFTKGLPVGLAFVGQAFGEANLIALAYAYEQHSKNRKSPEFINSIEA